MTFLGSLAIRHYRRRQVVIRFVGVSQPVNQRRIVRPIAHSQLTVSSKSLAAALRNRSLGLRAVGRGIWSWRLARRCAGRLRAQLSDELLRFLVALLGRLPEPEQRLREICGQPFAPQVHDAEIVLRRRHPLIGGFAIPKSRIPVALRCAFTRLVHVAESGLRRSISVLGRLPIPADCLPLVLGLPIGATQLILQPESGKLASAETHAGTANAGFTSPSGTAGALRCGSSGDAA